MARTAVKTLLSLHSYARVMGLNLRTFNNLRAAYGADQGAREFWTQADHDALAVYIAQAEAKLADALRFDVAPTARSGQRLWLANRDARWWLDNLTAPHGQLVAFGTPVLSVLEADAEVTYTGDAASVTLTGMDAELDPADVRVFFTATDGADAAGSEAYRIRDVTCSLAGTTLTIRAPRAAFTLPDVLAGDEPGDYADDDSFAAAVDVYLTSIDGELPLTLVWDTVRTGSGGDPTSDRTHGGAARIVDAAPGVFQARPAIYADGEHRFEYPPYGGAPDYLLADYVAGYPLADPAAGRLDARLEAAVVRLANVLSPDYRHPLNDLAESKWRSDRAMPTDENPLRPDELDNPFGYTGGARFAWDVVRQMRNYRLPF